MTPHSMGRLLRDRTTRTVALVALCALVLCVLTWQVARRTESPDQAEARARPPEAVPVHAALRSGYLLPPISLTVEARAERVAKVTAADTQAGVVSHVAVATGDEVHGGQLLLRVNGQPVFVLPMRFAPYRDLVGGETGDDVTALQEALVASGLTVGSDDPGTFGPGTKRAVAEMYERAGQPAPNDDAAVQSQIDDLTARSREASVADPSLLAEARALAATLGPRLLRSEIVVTPVLPARVQSVVGVGSTIADASSIVELGAGGVVLTARLPATAVSSLVTGAEGTAAVDGEELTATVTSIDPVEDGEVTVRVAPEVAVPRGERLVLTFANPGAAAKPSLLAPAASVVTEGGRSFVFVFDDGRYVRTPVTVLGSEGATVAIEAAGLSTDTEVRVGDD